MDYRAELHPSLLEGILLLLFMLFRLKTLVCMIAQPPLPYRVSVSTDLADDASRSDTDVTPSDPDEHNYHDDS